MSRVLIVGATRGLGARLARQSASRPDVSVYGTTRSGSNGAPKDFPDSVRWLTGIDLMDSAVWDTLVSQLPDSNSPLSVAVSIMNTRFNVYGCRIPSS